MWGWGFWGTSGDGDGVEGGLGWLELGCGVVGLVGEGVWGVLVAGLIGEGFWGDVIVGGWWMGWEWWGRERMVEWVVWIRGSCGEGYRYLLGG